MENSVNGITIAIDGPAGAGKSTVAKLIAKKLGYTYIDTGAMYRATAWKGYMLGLKMDNEQAWVDLAKAIRIAFQPDMNGGQRVLADGVDITTQIRTSIITQLSSPVSAISGVRRALVILQQAMGRKGGVVMEGRDIGTVVFPNAELKIFIVASEFTRAERRWKECQDRGEDITLKQVLEDQRERDKRDSERTDSPLKPAPDSVTIDSDGLSVQEVVDRILVLCKDKGAY